MPSEENSRKVRNPKLTLRRLARHSPSGLVTTRAAAELLGIHPNQASLTLGRLVQRGWLIRARRGLYLVLPLEAGTESGVIEDPWILARELYAPCYVGGWTAAEHWGLTEQIFRSTFVVTAATIRHSLETFLKSDFRLVRAKRDRVASVATVWRGRERVAVSDRERTIADALAKPGWVGGIQHLVQILRAYRQSKEWNPTRLIERLDEIGSGAAFKRLGYLAEVIFPDQPRLIDAALARRTTGVVKLDPSVPGTGRLATRWRLWVNVPIKRGGWDS